MLKLLSPLVALPPLPPLQLFYAIVLSILSAYAAIAAPPVARWEFDSETSTPFELKGDVFRDQAGPRPPQFPDFPADNTALRFDGAGFLTIADPGTDSEFDFTGGDKITLEAWVRIDHARGGQQMYVVSKGRTAAPGVKRDNQNWALRTVSIDGTVRASFLFATPFQGQSPVGDSHWHRWISTGGFAPGSGWHHIAVAYQFGVPESIRGWIDGVPTSGVWDMGGPTMADPVVDNDSIWIGSSTGGNPGNSFRGWMDGVAIHRDILSDAVMAARFHRVGDPPKVGPQTEVMPELGEIAPGETLVTLSEELPANNRWLNEGESWPDEALRWTGEEFLLSRIPIRYDSTGMRASWKPPLLLRMAGDVEMPAGKYRLLLRVRALSRLWIDGKLVARTKANVRRTGQEAPVVPIPPPLVPDARLLPFPQQEEFVEYEIGNHIEGEALPAEKHSARTVRVVLELVVGSPNERMETGEVVVAIQPGGAGPLFVLRPAGSSPLMLTDDAIEPVIANNERRLCELEDTIRRTNAASQDEFWQRRHELARSGHAKQTAGTATAGTNVATHPIATHPIDDLLNAKIQRAMDESVKYDAATTGFFHGEVLPILQEQCFRCHGEKQRGGLRLNSRDAALSEGESGTPAVVPGDLDASELIARVRDGDMPPTDGGLTEQQIATLEQWVSEGALWPAPPLDPQQVTHAAIVDDAALLRRAYLDIVGVGPTAAEAMQFLDSDKADRRERLIDQLLSDDRYADHWISFWLDLLAENPTLLNASLNSTGPFRWFLYDALRDNQPVDRMVTDLVLMRGSPHDGGSAGFALAGENDSPMAAKAHILASAFLGVEMQCARCHDSPFHSTLQADLYSLAAMLNRKSLVPPKTSRVPDEFFTSLGRESLIKVTLKPGESVDAKWPFAEFTGVEDNADIDVLMRDPKDTRERLAALITAPQNKRFPQVVVNHLWTRLIGTGIVAHVNDWEGDSPSHPELLHLLADELVSHDYDLKHVLRLIMTSQLYQREAIGRNHAASAQQRFFVAPDPRRLTAEQIVDSLFHATGREIDSEELTFVHDGSDTSAHRLSLGMPRRAWMFAGLNNERDRPSLAMPRAQSVVDVLESFGWTGTRQQPIFVRETDPSVLQPGILAGGTLTMSLSRAAYDSSLADLAIEAKSPDELLDRLFLRFLSRYPQSQERGELASALAAGFEQRRLPPSEVETVILDPPLPQSTWTNHLLPQANQIQEQWQERVRRGPPPDPRLRPQWREVYEDVVWSLINHREFVWVP